MHPNEQKLRDAFQKVLGVVPASDWDTLAYRKTKGWDSVAHMQIVAEVEDRFGIMMETDDILALSSYPVAIKLLPKYGVNLHA